MAHSQDDPPPPVIDPDELQIHRLYRERIVQEDNLINHRMMWTVLSQAFLLAIWGVLIQKIFQDHPVHFRFLAHIIAVIGFLFALGSKLAIRAAQDEIDELRQKYLCLYPTTIAPVVHPAWDWIIYIIDLRVLPFYRGNQSQFNIPRLEQAAGSRTDVLPGLTGSQHFHQLGHLAPKGMPFLLMLMWICLFFAVHL
jgi:hypothetical protein